MIPVVAIGSACGLSAARSRGAKARGGGAPSALRNADRVAIEVSRFMHLSSAHGRCAIGVRSLRLPGRPPRPCALAAPWADRSGAPRAGRRDVDGRRRSSRRAALRVAVGRWHAQRAARCRGTCRRCSSRRRSRPRIAASGRIPASIPIAIARALRQNLVEGRVVEGGSTITQQVAKLLLESPVAETRRAGCERKIREAMLALRLEHRFEKRDDARASISISRPTAIRPLAPARRAAPTSRPSRRC